jgi:hypothetical protein
LTLVTRAPLGRDSSGLDTGWTLPDQELRGADRIGAAAQDRIEEAVDDGVRSVRDLVHQSDVQRRVGVEALAGEEVAPRMRADLRQHERRDDGGNDPEPHLGEAEDGVGRGDCDVRARRQPAPAAERVAVHARDHRRRAGVDRLAHLV